MTLSQYLLFIMHQDRSVFSMFADVHFVWVLYDRWLAIGLGQGRSHIEFDVGENESLQWLAVYRGHRSK